MLSLRLIGFDDPTGFFASLRMKVFGNDAEIGAAA
jgi:hypothetical protein